MRPLTVELLDDRDQPLPDYAGVNAAVISKDVVHGPVTWPKVNSNRLPEGQPVSVR